MLRSGSTRSLRVRRVEALGGSFFGRGPGDWPAWRAAVRPSIIGTIAAARRSRPRFSSTTLPKEIFGRRGSAAVGHARPGSTSSWGETCSASSVPTSAFWARKTAATAATGSTRTASSTRWPTATPLPSIPTRSRRNRSSTSSPVPRPFRLPPAAAVSAVSTARTGIFPSGNRRN